MKKILVLIIGLGLLHHAKAQGHTIAVYHAPVYVYRPGLSFGVGYFSPFYSPYGYYNPYGPYIPYGSVYHRQSKLERKEEDIRMDYADKIYSVRQDQSLSKKEKRQTVRALKKQRNQEIHELVANYHKQPPTQ